MQQGTTGEEYVEEEVDAGEVRTYPQGPDTIPALKSGTIDAVVIDRPVAEKAIEEDSGIEISAGIETEEEYGFVVQQGDEELLDELNEGLKEVLDDGTYTRIYEKWFDKRPAGRGLLGDARSDLSLRPARRETRAGGAERAPELAPSLRTAERSRDRPPRRAA